jgi:hypothetical protein
MAGFGKKGAIKSVVTSLAGFASESGIEQGLALGRNIKAIWQDLVSDQVWSLI